MGTTQKLKPAKIPERWGLFLIIIIIILMGETVLTQPLLLWYAQNGLILLDPPRTEGQQGAPTELPTTHLPPKRSPSMWRAMFSPAWGCRNCRIQLLVGFGWVFSPAFSLEANISAEGGKGDRNAEILERRQMEGSKPRVRCKGCPAFKNQLVKTSQAVPFPQSTICELPPGLGAQGLLAALPAPPVVSSPGQEFPCKNVGGSQGKWGANQGRGGYLASLPVCLPALLPAQLSAHPCSLCHIIFSPFLFPSLLGIWG